MLFRRKLVMFGPREVLLTSDEPVVKQFLNGRRIGPIGMSEEKDEATMAEEQTHLEAGHVDGGVERHRRAAADPLHPRHAGAQGGRLPPTPSAGEPAPAAQGRAGAILESFEKNDKQPAQNVGDETGRHHLDADGAVTESITVGGR